MPDIDLKHLQRLAALRLSEAETEHAQADLVRIIDMIDAMQMVDTTDVAPMSHPLDVAQSLRTDEVTEPNDRERFQSVAPDTDNGFYLVPRVVE